jgi:RES domain-containing protein
MVYASSSRALALLEILAHIDRDDAPRDLEYARLEIPDDAIGGVPILPSDWDVSPPAAATRALGDAWTRGGASLALIVPSVIVSKELNVLINPAHGRFAEIVVSSDGPVVIDARLLGDSSP